MEFIIKKKHILILRTSSLIIDFRTYNCQETGLATVLVKKGYRVSFVTPGLKNEHIQLPVSQNGVVDVYTVTFSRLNRNICWYHGFFKLMKSIKPDLLHINSISLSMSLFALLWAKKNSIQTVVIQGNYDVTHKPLLKQLEQCFNHTIGRYIIEHTNGIGCKTRWAADFIKQYSPKAEVHLTRIGLDTTKFTHDIEIDWRNKLGIDTENKVLLYVGALESRRNPLFLIDILRELSNEYVLIIVGKGSLEKDLANTINRYSLTPRCYMLGQLEQEKLPSLYKQSDLFLLPSSYEIFGMVILESMYFGTPVISTLSAGSDVIIQDQADGIIIKELDAKQWQTSITDLLKNEQKFKRMCEAAKKKIIEHLTWEKTANEFIDLYEKAFKNAKK